MPTIDILRDDAENERNSPHGATLASAPALERSRKAELAKAARREEILAAARRVFAERGFRGTTIADIAEEAGIALGTIYLYYPSKEAVFAALNERLGEIVSDSVQAVPPTRSVLETTRKRVRRVFDACSRNRDLVRLVVLNTDPGTELTRRMQATAEARNRPLARELGAAVAAGTVRPCDPAVTARLIEGMVSMAVYQAFVLSGGEDADTYRDTCADMIAAYLQPVAGPSPDDGGAGR
jgi:AcrR family transcriptional regulator